MLTVPIARSKKKTFMFSGCVCYFSIDVETIISLTAWNNFSLLPSPAGGTRSESFARLLIKMWTLVIRAQVLAETWPRAQARKSVAARFLRLLLNLLKRRKIESKLQKIALDVHPSGRGALEASVSCFSFNVLYLCFVFALEYNFRNVSPIFFCNVIWIL